jgi:hypothetical protein
MQLTPLSSLSVLFLRPQWFQHPTRLHNQSKHQRIHWKGMLKPSEAGKLASGLVLGAAFYFFASNVGSIPGGGGNGDGGGWDSSLQPQVARDAIRYEKNPGWGRVS